MLDLNRFMIAVALVSVNHDGRGGTAPDPLVWDQGGRQKARELAVRVTVDLASLPGPPGFLGVPGFRLMVVTLLELILLPGLRVGILIKFTSFFWVPHIGLLVPMTSVILEFLFWSF